MHVTACAAARLRSTWRDEACRSARDTTNGVIASFAPPPPASELGYLERPTLHRFSCAPPMDIVLLDIACDWRTVRQHHEPLFRSQRLAAAKPRAKIVRSIDKHTSSARLGRLWEADKASHPFSRTNAGVGRGLMERLGHSLAR